ncbi:MAG: type IV conjugative transfer system protein TraL [Alphaproteobacteria bacterium]|nr:type IV conjugative transfer system protein TraL [Alphaproteobacteria bacterium]MBP9776759.1 type IV conjugative transfer system protein TraL [Alphaproteobacteria bacterium]
MDISENFLLNRLDKPLRFLGINKDEALIVIIPLFGGLFMGWIISGLIVGIGALSGLRTIKKQNEGSTLIHALYWHFPMPRKSMKLPVPSHIREMIG